MGAVFYSAIIAISIYYSFSFGKKFFNNLKYSFRSGLFVAGFWLFWTLGGSVFFVGVHVTPFSILFYWQMGLIISVFLWSYRRHKKAHQIRKEHSIEVRKKNERIVHLEKIIKNASNEQQEKIDKLKHKLKDIADHNEFKKYIEPLEGVKEHRKKLFYALDNAKKNICIHSGWATDWVVDNEFKEKIRNSLSKGVNLYIGYGHGSSKKKFFNFLSKKSNENAAKSFGEIMNWCEEKNVKGNLDVFIFDNHAKELICDNNFYVIGSFNWLSNKEGKNKEKSITITNAAFVNQESKRFIKKFDSPFRINRREMINKLLKGIFVLSVPKK